MSEPQQIEVLPISEHVAIGYAPDGRAIAVRKDGSPAQPQELALAVNARLEMLLTELTRLQHWRLVARMQAASPLIVPTRAPIVVAR